MTPSLYAVRCCTRPVFQRSFDFTYFELVSYLPSTAWRDFPDLVWPASIAHVPNRGAEENGQTQEPQDVDRDGMEEAYRSR